MIELLPPDVRFQRSYLDATAEFADTHRDGDGDLVEPAEGDFPGYAFTPETLRTEEGFAAFVERRRAAARPEAPRRPGRTLCTFRWVVEDDTYLGSLAIRHTLTEYLLREGGHIGYSVRPSARRRGVATEALRLALPLAHDLGIDPVLVTCAESNDASRRVIEACGGVYEDSSGDTRRYWLATGTTAGAGSRR